MHYQKKRILMQRSPKPLFGTNFGSQKSPRASVQKASTNISRTFQTIQRLQRTMAGPSVTTVQNESSDRTFALFNKMRPHYGD